VSSREVGYFFHCTICGATFAQTLPKLQFRRFPFFGGFCVVTLLSSF